jgi:DinB superfamily
MTACDECGYDFESLSRAEILAAVPALAGEHCDLLRSVTASQLVAHTRPGSWSPLEYGCHVRDMLAVQRDRVLLAQAEQRPLFASMRRDERAVEEAYNEQDPVTVAAEVAAAAGAFCQVLTAGAGRRGTDAASCPRPSG